MTGVIAAETEYTLECRLWPHTNWDADPLADSANWNAGMCQTSMNANVATCSCYGTGYIAIFEGDPIILTTTEDPTTTVAPTTTVDSVEATSSAEASTAPDAPNTTLAETLSTTQAPVKLEKKTIAVTFSIDANYDDVIGNNETKKQEFIDNLKPQIAKKLKVKESQIKNMDVNAGSIVTTFDVVQEDGTGTVDIQSQIATMKKDAEAGSLQFTAPDGSTLPVKKDSFTTVEEKDDGISDGALAGIIIGVILGLILIITIIALLMNNAKKRHGLIGKVMPESDSDLEGGQEGQYRSVHNSPENLGYEGGDEGDSPKDLESGNNNNGNEYQEVGAPTIASTSNEPPAQVTYETPVVAAGAPDDSTLYETVVPGQTMSDEKY